MSTSVFLWISYTHTGVYQRHIPPPSIRNKNKTIWPQGGSIALDWVTFRLRWQWGFQKLHCLSPSLLWLHVRVSPNPSKNKSWIKSINLRNCQQAVFSQLYTGYGHSIRMSKSCISTQTQQCHVNEIYLKNELHRH